MKVYVVTTGQYSDYGITAICSTKEMGEYANLLYGDEANGVDEWEVDELPKHPEGKLPFTVQMKESGDSEVKRESIGYFKEKCEPYGDDETFCFDVWAKDEQHAVKIANEKRVQLIANGEWTVSWETWKKRKQATP